MTIEKREPGLWFVICDSCGEVKELDTDPDDHIGIAASDAREAGFQALKSGDDWIHKCNDCREYDNAKALREAGLGFEEDHRTGNERTTRSIKHSYRSEGRNWVD